MATITSHGDGGDMPRITVKDVEQQIHETERFKVRFRNPDGRYTRGNMEVKAEYDLITAAPANWTIEEWRKKRFLPRYQRQRLNVDVFRGDTKEVARGNTKLSTVRRTYIK